MGRGLDGPVSVLNSFGLACRAAAAAQKVDEVSGRCMWNVDDYGPEVASHLRIGDQVEDFERHVREFGWPEFVARQTLEALVSELGLSISAIDSSVEPVSSQKPIFCRSLDRTIPPGHLIGTVDTTKVRTAEGPCFSFSMEGRVYTADQTDMNEWHVTGEPNLHLRNDRASYRFTTCTSVVNRIPNVINAALGLVSLDQLGKPNYRHLIQN